MWKKSQNTGNQRQPGPVGGGRGKAAVRARASGSSCGESPCGRKVWGRAGGSRASSGSVSGQEKKKRKQRAWSVRERDPVRGTVRGAPGSSKACQRVVRRYWHGCWW